MDFLSLSTTKSCTTPFTESSATDNDCTLSNMKESKSVSNKKEKYVKNILQKEYAVQYTAGNSLITKHTETTAFPYPGTKLRADAPPFTPEGIIISVENIPHVTLDMTSVNKERFLNVNLPQDSINQIFVDNHDFEEIKERELQSFGPVLNQPIGNLLPDVNMIEKDVSEVAVEASPSTVVREEIALTQYPRRPSILLRRFTFESRTQITILIVSIIISAVLIVYVFV